MAEYEQNHWHLMRNILGIRKLLSILNFASVKTDIHIKRVIPTFSSFQSFPILLIYTFVRTCCIWRVFQIFPAVFDSPLQQYFGLLNNAPLSDLCCCNQVCYQVWIIKGVELVQLWADCRNLNSGKGFTTYKFKSLFWVRC